MRIGRCRIAAVAVPLVSCCGWGAAPARAAVTFGQIDTFQDGTAMDWDEGIVSPNRPTNVPTGGPAGAGDAYLRNVSTGGLGGSGSHQVMFNRSQWTGDYAAAGVTRVEGDLANFGTTPLVIRVAVKGPGGSWYGSNDGFSLPADGAWRHAGFDLAASTTTALTGVESLPDVLAGVTELRILSAKFGPAFAGDVVASTLGVDNVRALRLPGDATFDNAVDFNDLVALARNYNTTGGNAWAQGDFTFDGNVDFNDLVVLARNYNTAGPGAPVPGAPAGFDRDVAAAFAMVPEPSSAVVLAVTGAVALTAPWRRVREHGGAERRQ
jgi:hypothetical protein